MKYILRIRYIYIIAVIFTFLNSIFFLMTGVIESLHGFKIFFKKLRTGEPILIGIYFMESLDRFLVSFVFMIFSLGIYKLFFVSGEKTDPLPAWLHIETFKDLKILLWETILVMLVVFTVSLVVNTTATKGPVTSSLDWNALILPAIILILSVSLYFMQKK